jgi:hypothetical protein
MEMDRVFSTNIFSNTVRVLRCRKTHRYFTGGGWSSDPAEARVYARDIDIAQECVSRNLHEVELVLRTAPSGAELFCTPVR